MEKVQQLLEKGTFAKTFMDNKEFVENTKEIFKSKNIEINNEQLTKLMEDVETQLKLKKSEILSDEELAHVSGGVTGKDVARFLIKGACIVVIGALGTFVGASLAVGIDYIANNGHYTLYTSGVTGGLLFAGVSGYLGGLLGDVICNKLGV